MDSGVFITDGHWRKTLSAVRALGSKGINVTVGESNRLATALFSKYCSRGVVYPSPFFEEAELAAFLLQELTQNSYKMLLPMEDVTLDMVSRHHEAFSKLTWIPLVSPEKLRLAQRKDKVLKLATKKGIPIPATWHIDDLNKIEEIKHTLPYPVVIKPREGSGAEGILFPENPDQLVSQYKKVHNRFPYPMIQELIPRQGSGFGASFLMNERGDVKASFIHQRLREYPVTGGASTLRISARHDEIREMGRTLLEAIGWFGVAMVEFKIDPRDNIPKLMEINPRFWGSLALAVESGVNFPWLLYRLSCGEDFKPVEEYEVGKKCRWLLPGDLLHFIYSRDRMKLMPSFFNFLDQDTAYDILSLKDPGPVLGRILMLLTLLYDRDIKHKFKKRT